jgi:hypothetical protein
MSLARPAVIMLSTAVLLSAGGEILVAVLLIAAGGMLRTRRPAGPA